MSVRRLGGWLRDAWLIAGLSLALLLLVELVAGMLVERPADGLRGTPWAIRREASPVYDDAPWKDDYWKEWYEAKTATWWPYVYWRRKPYAGRYIHVDAEGLRATRPTTPLAEATTHVLFLGGSTLWGMGARDEHTIPSLVGRELRARGLAGVHIRNLAQDGYVSTQEVLTLLLEIRAGRIPDVVVFYDGFNDTYAAHQNGVAGLPQNEANRRAEFNLGRQTGWSALRPAVRRLALASLVRELRKAGEPSARDGDGHARSDAATPTRLADEVLDAYLANLEIVQALATQYGFEAHFFWQPSPFSKASPSAAEREIQAEWHAADLQRAVEAALRERSGLPAAFVDLQGVFADDSRTYFLDYAHLGEAGNAVVARAMTEVLAASDDFAAR